jgi:hypothetical protein
LLILPKCKVGCYVSVSSNPLTLPFIDDKVYPGLQFLIHFVNRAEICANRGASACQVKP